MNDKVSTCNECGYTWYWDSEEEQYDYCPACKSEDFSVMDIND